MTKEEKSKEIERNIEAAKWHTNEAKWIAEVARQHIEEARRHIREAKKIKKGERK